MKEKLTINHLAPYLPYELQLFQDTSFWHKTFKNQIVILNYIKLLHFEYDEDTYLINYYYPKKAEIEGEDKIKYFKPILRPLSDLTKEIEHNGEKFVPIEKINSLYPEYPLFTEDNHIYIMDSCELNMLEMHEVYKIYQKLFEWHFDVFNLIEKGLAIDINNL